MKGAGQGGLTSAARLHQLGVPTLIIDRNPRIGDNWRNRYHQLVLHDPVWYDHLPYIPFPAHWPKFTPKGKLVFHAHFLTLLPTFNKVLSAILHDKRECTICVAAQWHLSKHGLIFEFS